MVLVTESLAELAEPLVAPLVLPNTEVVPAVPVVPVPVCSTSGLVTLMVMVGAEET